MSGLFPSLPKVELPTDREPRVLSLDSEDADEVLSAISSKTARQILCMLYEDPSTPPEIEEELDTSRQNAHYHLEKLEDAGLVEVIDKGYSSTGKEMKVYAPTDKSLVLFAGPENDRTGMKNVLMRFLGALSLISLVSVLVEFVGKKWWVSKGPVDVGVGFGSDQSQKGFLTGVIQGIQEFVGDFFVSPGPGLMFLLGATTVLVIGFVWRYWKKYPE